MPTEQYARVPIALIGLVDARAIELYVALCKYAGAQGHTRVLNPRLSAATGQSDAAVRRSLKQLEDVGAITRAGRQQRVIRVIPVDHLSLTGERKDRGSIAHTGATKRSQVSDLPRCSDLDTHSLRSCDAATDESEAHVQAEPEVPMFEIEPTAVEVHEKPIGAACLAAFIDAYGPAPISRPMIGRLGKRFKELGDTYSRAELLAAAVELGTQQVVNVNAIEPYVLKARQPGRQSQVGWSALAADTFAQLADPFDQRRTV